MCVWHWGVWSCIVSNHWFSWCPSSSIAWWRHQMETFAALLALCVGNSPVNSPHKCQWRGALMFSLICAWKQSWGWLCETPSCSLWRHCDGKLTLLRDQQRTYHAIFVTNRRNINGQVKLYQISHQLCAFTVWGKLLLESVQTMSM